MTKKAFLALCLLMLLSLPAYCQVIEQKSLVTVTGTGEMEVVPDEVSLFISVQNFDREASTSRIENERRTKAVLAVIQKLGIEQKDYQTRLSSIEPRYKGDNDTKQLLGYVSNSGISVKLRAVPKLSELKTNAIVAGATSVGDIHFSSSHLIEHRAEARAMALKAARQKAAFMAEQLGQKIGRAFTISEVANNPYSGNMMSNSYSFSAEDPGQSNTLATGVISVVEKVSVSFELI